MFTGDPLHDHDYSFATAPIFLPSLTIPAGNDHDFISALKPEFGYTSSGCSSYGGGSPTSPASQSLHMNQQLEAYSFMNSSHAYFESEAAGSFRKALSTGDLQGVNLTPRSCCLQYSSESSIIESMNRASPYGPEEKKERIERYRSKKNLRNFNKKIKYECRKTLADSRPRIRGRFARNDELEKTTQEDDHVEDDDDNNWIHFLENLIP
ncbi:zinc finger protein HD1-like [Henckelia pumila]|uniref:zinc finger protein HD1-like n=1 Tax=Henckelia pumila TaxID=405737 RepID=UPI003C6E95AD